MNAVLKKWFPNTLNIVVFVFAFSFVSFCVFGAAMMWYNGTHYKRPAARAMTGASSVR